MSDIPTKRKLRGSIRSSCTRISNKITSELDGDSPDINVIKASAELVREKQLLIGQFNEEIIASLETEEEDLDESKNVMITNGKLQSF
jgi:hypothetical protein